MVNAGSWLVRDMKNKDKFPFDFNVGVAYLPRFDETVEGPRSNYSCSVLGIPENSKHKEEAWRFIRYYVEECSNYIAASGKPAHLPSRLQRRDGEYFLRGLRSGRGVRQKVL